MPDFDGDIKLGISFDASSVGANARLALKGFEKEVTRAGDVVSELDSKMDSFDQSAKNTYYLFGTTVKRTINNVANHGAYNELENLEKAGITTNEQLERAQTLITTLTRQTSLLSERTDTLKQYMRDYLDEYTLAAKKAEEEARAEEERAKAAEEQAQKEREQAINQININAYRAQQAQAAEEKRAIMSQILAEEQETREREAAERVRKAWVTAITKAASIVKSVFTKAFNTAHSVINNIQKAIRSISKYMLGIKKSTDRGFKNVLKYAFGIRGVFILIRRLRSLFKEVFEEIGKQAEPFGTMLKDFKNSWTELKGSFVAAFTPIAQVVLPILTRIINKLTEAANTAGMFIASLLGQKTYLKAKAIEEVNDELNNTADAAKEAKKQILGFDDVTILSDPNKNKTEESKASDSKWEFTETPIGTTIEDLAKRLRELIQAQDWEGVGNYFAEAVNGVFTKAYNAINNTKLEEKINSTISAITRTINSFAQNTDWDLIGRTIGSGINLAFGSLNKFFDGIDWYENAVAFTKGINGLIDEIKWDEIGLFFANKLNALIQSALGFVETFNWEEFGTSIGEAISTFLTNFDFESVGKGINALVTGLVKAIAAFVTTVDWTEVVNSIFDGIAAVFGVETYHAELKKASDELLGPVNEAVSSAVKGLEGFQQSAEDTMNNAAVKAEWLDDVTERYAWLSENVDKLSDEEMQELRDMATKLSDEIPGFNKVIDKETGAWQGTRDALRETIQAQKDHIMMAAQEAVVQQYAELQAQALAALAKAESAVGKAHTDAVKSVQRVQAAHDEYEKTIRRINNSNLDAEEKQRAVNEAAQAYSDTLEHELGPEAALFVASSDNLVYAQEVIAERYGLTTRELGVQINTYEEAVETQKTAKQQLTELIDEQDGVLTSLQNMTNGVKDSNKTINENTKFTEAKKELADFQKKLREDTNVDAMQTNFRRGFAASNQHILNQVSTFRASTQKLMNTGVTQEVQKGVNASSTEASRIPSKIRDALINGSNQVVRGANSMISTIRDLFLGQNWASLGDNVSGGIASGISRSVGAVTTAIHGVATSAVAKARQVLQIQSPSHVFRDEVGEMIPLGISAGIDAGTMGVLSTVANLSESLVDKATGALEMPSIAAGKVIPYSSAQQGTSTEQALLNILDLLYNNRVTEEGLRSMMADVVRENMNIEFYIGDEQISRHAQAGSARIDRRLNPVSAGSY